MPVQFSETTYGFQIAPEWLLETEPRVALVAPGRHPSHGPVNLTDVRHLCVRTTAMNMILHARPLPRTPHTEISREALSAIYPSVGEVAPQYARDVLEILGPECVHLVSFSSEQLVHKRRAVCVKP